jgi:hypothetical protein
MLLANCKSPLNTKPSLLSAGAPLCAVILLLLCAASLHATTVAQYRERLHSAVLLLNGLLSEKNSEMNPGGEASMGAVFGKVRALLPAKETVEASAGSYEVNNAWLHQALSECEKIPAGLLRAEKLSRIMERLQALGVRLNEIESATPPDTASKYKNKAKLAEILQRSEYQKKAAEGGALARLWQRVMKWLNSLFPQSKQVSSDGGSGAAVISQVAQIFVVALALAVIAYVAWKLAPRFLRSRNTRKKGKREARIVLGERLEPDQTAGDLLADAEALARAGDLRAAIRKAYIALLCELGDRKLIRLAQHKTNRDYLSAVREIVPLHEELRKLTRSFENHWYGFTPATESEWTSFRNGYQRAVSSHQGSGK